MTEKDTLCMCIFQTLLVYLLLSAVPSGPPLNIHELSSSPSTVILEWDPPLQEDRNGVITGYLVNITEVESGKEFQFSSSTNSLSIDSLTPFTTYTCVIAATTIVGHGPYSNTIVVLTPEDGKCLRRVCFWTMLICIHVMPVFL